MLFGLDDPRTLIVHLRMTGKLQLAPAAGPPAKHEHVILDLDDGRNLHYQDPRKFGRFWLTPTPETVLAKLGPEPLGPDFTPAYLIDKLAGRKAPIKALLLDQRIVAGIGNIYADETLYRAQYTRRSPPATCRRRSRSAARRCAGRAASRHRTLRQQQAAAIYKLYPPRR